MPGDFLTERMARMISQQKKKRSSFYSRYWRRFGKSLPIVPYFPHQISHFSGAKTHADLLFTPRNDSVFVTAVLHKREHWRRCENSHSPISLCNIGGVRMFVYCRVKDIMDWIKGRWFIKNFFFFFKKGLLWHEMSFRE